jgi:UPF0755 protein
MLQSYITLEKLVAEETKKAVDPKPADDLAAEPTTTPTASTGSTHREESTHPVLDAQSSTGKITEPTRSKSGTVTFTKGSKPVKKKRQGWRATGVIFLLLAFTAAAAALYVRQQLSPVATVSAPSEFEVEPGWGAARIASELEDAGLIRNARLFSFYLRRQGLDRNIGEGLYDLDPAMSVATIATTLNGGGRARIVRVVIPEGFRMKDIAKTLVAVNLAEEETFLELFQNAARPDYLDKDKPLEGYLFPASYDIPVKSTPEDIVKFLLGRFEQELSDEVQAKLAELGWTVPGWVTLASVVQAEAANAAEMPIIAGVFINRLEEGMPLQSDPTVAYGLGKDLPELDRSAGDFENDNAWNTYIISGLPATPINNPGREALQAVLNPVRENEDGQKNYYFLHGTDAGRAVFKVNTNFDDHLRDVNLYLQ